MKSKVLALGNSPSSGSTFFADLLDSTEHTACGPEISLFSLDFLYDYDNFKHKLKNTSKCSAVYFERNILGYNDICEYGLNEKKIYNLVNKSNSLGEFLNNFALHYLSLRGKNTSGIVYEKSPQNIHCVKEYLENTDNYFIHIVRNPINIYKSLLKRGILNNISLITWLIEEAQIYDYLDHERVIVVKYEDLLLNPYKITRDIIKKTSGIDVLEEEIEYNYKNNEYRKYHSIKLNSWNNTTFGVIGEDKKKSFIEEELNSLASLKDLKVSKQYAQYFNIADVSFVDVVKKLGYYDSYIDIIDNREEKFCFSKKEKYKLFRKFTGDVKYGDASLLDMWIYLNPVANINDNT